MYIDFCIENNEKDPTFEDGDHLRISEYKKKVSLQIGLEKFLLLNSQNYCFVDVCNRRS